MDSYFDCTEFFEYNDYMKFIERVERDVNIDDIDVAKVILCKKSLSHLELQKILFFVAKELITKYDIQLFKEEFECCRLGLVVPSVYHKYKKYGESNIFIEDRFKYYYDLLEELLMMY